MKKIILSVIFLLFTIGSGIGFYYVGGLVNYPKHVEIKREIVSHPEFIPSSRLVEKASAGYGNIISDFYWLSVIQYVGDNVIGSEYKKFLFVMLNLVTDVNPNFTYPYRLGELLLSNYNERYEDKNKNSQEIYNKQALEIGLKGIEKTCDINKIEAIKNEYTISKLWESDYKFKDPCKESNIPYYLAYVYYWNFHDGVKASQYYRITAANSDAPTGSRIMVAIMQGKGGDREKSISMFLSLAESLGTKESQQCRDFSSELTAFIAKLYQNNWTINGNFLKAVEKSRKAIETQIGGTKEESIDNGTDCFKYLNKAVREINLAYLEGIDSKYYQDKKKHAYSAKVLLEDKYIDYIPIDYQWAKDFPINYFYNKDTGHWDNKVEGY